MEKLSLSLRSPSPEPGVLLEASPETPVLLLQQRQTDGLSSDTKQKLIRTVWINVHAPEHNHTHIYARRANGLLFVSLVLCACVCVCGVFGFFCLGVCACSLACLLVITSQGERTSRDMQC